ncbi:hypothetical protein L6164_024176 [Bauhinia variegata]|uniref:Uncharacterized protein n=1 Tax=Bauhinia variegata TaxID=167791 RepID=A0ACB9LXK2_BAUVA|nr:hypothetical protein L6164_024176 [Bauhinia variegata]
MPETEINPTISKSTGLPRKRFYRARAHSNPLSDSHFPIPISLVMLTIPSITLNIIPHLVKLIVLKESSLLILAVVSEGCLSVGGIIYTITDVEELGDWMKSCLENHPMFEALSEKELEADPVVKLLSSATEEGQKVARNGGQTFQAVFRRIVPSDQTS